MAEPPSASSLNDTTPTDARPSRKEICDLEYAHYYKERDGWTEVQLEAEKSYDNQLIGISTLALGALFTQVNGIHGGTGQRTLFVLSLIFFGLCLVSSLLHSYCTYYTHKRWVEIVDAEFDPEKWEPNAFQRALERYDSIPFIRMVERFKAIGGIALAMGLLLLAIFFAREAIAGGTEEPSLPHVYPNVSQVVNIDSTANIAPTTRSATATTRASAQQANGD